MRNERFLRKVRLLHFNMGGGGGGQPTSSTNTTQNFSPEEAARRTQVMDEAKRIYDSSGPQLASSAYPGAQVVPYSADTIAAQNYLKNVSVPAAERNAQSINDAVGFGLKDVLYPGSNPALQQTIDASTAPITSAWSGPGGTLSKIRDQGITYNQLGGTRNAIAESKANEDYLRAVGDTAAKVATTGYNSGLDTFGRTLAFAPQAVQAATMPATLLSTVGAQNENLQLEQNQYLSDQAMWGLNAPWAPLQNYASLVYGGASPSTSSTSTGIGAGGGSKGRSAIGGAVSGAAAGASFGPWGALAGGVLGALFS